MNTQVLIQILSGIIVGMLAYYAKQNNENAKSMSVSINNLTKEVIELRLELSLIKEHCKWQHFKKVA